MLLVCHEWGCVGVRVWVCHEWGCVYKESKNGLILPPLVSLLLLSDNQTQQPVKEKLNSMVQQRTPLAGKLDKNWSFLFCQSSIFHYVSCFTYHCSYCNFISAVWTFVLLNFISAVWTFVLLNFISAVWAFVLLNYFTLIPRPRPPLVSGHTHL